MDKDRILITIGFSCIGLLLIFTLYAEVMHRWRIHKADGVWCVWMNPQGNKEVNYGRENCSVRPD
ncbi:hypothetical protein [Roseofilum capinflatum]|uniref:Uncharacterized protein n=1 Tax=Roseofilum capinflatum BLCC-M114 TaxID=3022440 RepID=A0ABT7B6P7_9CYAN|nr:hypothetical protein [Roseofilum capinflatum]MDJ1174517.1 hypothetical protein [Roseofilum capinflatum BLCC-M114]